MKKWQERINGRIITILNRYNLTKKFMILYTLCVIIPLFVTDTLIIKSVYERERRSYQYDMEYVTSLYQNYLLNIIENNRILANTVNMNNKINEFLSASYKSPYDYYDAYCNTMSGSFMQTLAGTSSDHITVYADNENILEGNSFKKLSTAKGTEWYREFVKDGETDRLLIFYDDSPAVQNMQKRKFYYVKKMNYHKKGCEKIVVIDNDCTVLLRELKKLGNKYPMYISYGDYLLFTNMDDSATTLSDLDIKYKKTYVTDFSLQGCDLKIVLFNEKKMITSVLKDNKTIIFCMVFITILLPVFVMQLIKKSIIIRIQKLERAFGDGADHTFNPIDDIDGSDEIAVLMHKYNEIVEITNNLIQTVYKDKLKEQENDIARKNAELLALQSQINPHFLFNALESIRMHSLLKGEEETSIMVGKLAVMQRQNVEWGSDFVTIKKEMESIEAYLYLQGYRFGDRLSFEIDVDEDCNRYLVPKLTVVTFVENACVHGVESKPTPGWIFVRTYKQDEDLVIEVEDTGGGMEEAEVKEMLRGINEVTIDTIKGKKHVGILNACLRLKMVTDNAVSFSIDSEPGVGMSVEIRIPLDKLEML